MKHSEKAMFDKAFLNTWYQKYNKVSSFGKLYCGEPDEELVNWVLVQRKVRHMLPGELQDKLSKLDSRFEDISTSWEAICRQLEKFVGKNGHAFLPVDKKHEGLRDWLNRQILSKALLSEKQFKKLDNLGVAWDAPISREHKWRLMFLRLQDFGTAFGHSRVPQGWPPDKQLANWVTVQRRSYAQKNMPRDRVLLLEGLRFVWDVKAGFNDQWKQYYQQLLSFSQKHGHCRVPGRNKKLVSWMERQRLAKKKDQLPEERERLLGNIGFIWSFEDIKEKRWEEKCRQLWVYREKHGHSFVPVNCKENKVLGIWVATQRVLEVKGKLGAAKKRKLDELGFVWSKDTQRCLKTGYDALWDKNFEMLKAYRDLYGTCQVSVKKDPELQRWTCWQRKLFYQGSLSDARIDKLNEICFPWSIQEGYWMRMYDALTEFRKQFGHTRVPRGWEQNKQLGPWIYRLRRDKHELSPQKIELLNRLGFDWHLARKEVVLWEQMYARLVRFKQEYGHTRVPVAWRRDPKLGKWVSRMRQEQDRLSANRKSLLESIGFCWRRTLTSDKKSKQPVSRNHNFADIF